MHPEDGNVEPFLGARLDSEGARFGVYSAHATRVELCLFDAPGHRETQRIPMQPDGEGHWTVHLTGVAAGQLYGYRAHGEHRPDLGLWFDPNKLLVDPRALAIVGDLRWRPEILATNRRPKGNVDTSPWVPKGVVVDESFDWQGDRPPRTALEDTVIYECHVRGQTVQHPGVEESLRGTYLGLCSQPLLDHFERLGVTALELMPVFHFESERHLADRGLRNYWGYSPLGFFAPHAGYARASQGQQVSEFKEMVRRLHRAGIEVILDVVFNHTVEGGADGAAIGLRGLDASTYYRSEPDHPGDLVDWTGCGNTLDASQPAVRRLILDSLRYWVDSMHVDGFRFDLATVLGRGKDPQSAFDAHTALLVEIDNDPALQKTRRIAEPWDLGPDGYQLGGFPDGWSEWNDRFREAQRRFWRGDAGSSRAFAMAFEGSPDVFPRRRRGPAASLNYVTAHDGFTLEDLVSYSSKRNEANGEDNRDGSNHNSSCNWGAEGPTESGDIRSLRSQIKKNLIASLAFSCGVPMIGHGDELGRTQRGNNNAYCQDNPTAWIDWSTEPEQREWLEFCRQVFALRAERPELRATAGDRPIVWYTSNGDPVDATAMDSQSSALIGLIAPAVDEGSRDGPRSTLAIALNGGRAVAALRLPRPSAAGRWHRLIDTAATRPRPIAGDTVELPAHSLCLLEFRRLLET